MSLLKIQSVSKSFDGLKAVDDFSCDLSKGEIISLIGPNGAGKTTLFNIITGFLNSDNGSIFLNDSDLNGFQPYKISRKGISRTFQDLRLITQITLLENVMLFNNNGIGEKLSNIFFRNKKIKLIEVENTKKASSLLEFVGLKEAANEKAGNISYGQQKLLSLACCLSSEPAILLLDEPVSGVQPAMIDKIFSILKELKKQGKTIFLIEHDINFVSGISDRIIVMDEGKKIAEGSPNEITSNHQILEAYLT